MGYASASVATMKMQASVLSIANHLAKVHLLHLPHLVNAMLPLFGIASNYNVCLALMAVYLAFLATNVSNVDLVILSILTASVVSRIVEMALDSH